MAYPRPAETSGRIAVVASGLAALATVLSGGCGTTGWTDEHTPTGSWTPTPTIARMACSGTVVRARVQDLGALPARLDIEVTDGRGPDPSPLPYATVLVGGQCAPWDPVELHYRIVPFPYPTQGANAVVSVKATGFAPVSGTVRFPGDPVWTSPVHDALHSASVPLVLSWNLPPGPPSTILLDASHKNPTPIAYGLPRAVAQGTATYLLPANALAVRAATPTPQTAEILLWSVSDSLLFGSVQAEQSPPLASFFAYDVALRRIRLDP